MRDLLVTENGDGGDIVVRSGKLLETTFIDTFVYISLFGGNYGKQTKAVEKGKEREYYWANDILYGELNKHDSRTEELLHSIQLVSSNIPIIERVATNDLKLLKNYVSDYKVKAYIIAKDVVRIDIFIYSLEGTEVASRYIYKRIEGGDFLLADFDENDFYTAE